MNFKLEISTNFEFLGNQICQRTFHKITEFHSHFQLKSKRYSYLTASILVGNANETYQFYEQFVDKFDTPKTVGQNF